MNDGEERLACLYADVHFWFSEPSARPAGHRFDKESYVYLYRHQTTSRGRVEVANHAGTPEQDAFTGYLDNAKVSQSHRHPSLVTIVVDGLKTETTPVQGTEWRLPSTDPRDEGKYLFRLHTVDVYFWTKEDATTFVQHCQQTLKPQQLDLDYPVEELHNDLASPVVQKLENMAVSDPAYSNNARGSISTSAVSPSPTTTEDKKSSANYTPLAYNPAAPAAPEKRAHREKTPPPPEEPGVGLAHAANDDHHSTSTPISNQPYTGVPTGSHGYSPAPSSQGVSSPPPSTAATSHSYVPTSKSSYSQHGIELPLESPTAQILGQSYVSSHSNVPLQHIQPQYADYLAQRQSPSQTAEGYSTYSYSQTGHGYRPQEYYPTSTGDTDIHSQVYRPTEEESHGKPAKPGTAGTGAAGPGKWEQKAEKAEKGLNRLLRKVEKKIG